MRLACLAFVAGVWGLQQCARLPTPLALWGLALALGAFALMRVCRAASPWLGRLSLVCLALTCGFAWADLRAEWRLAQPLDAALEGKDLRLSGRIASMPQSNEVRSRFVFAVESPPPGVPPRLLLSWYAPRERDLAAPPEPLAGSRWEFALRLRAPHGSSNPHGFDYAGWLFARGIGATAYVREGRALPAAGLPTPGMLAERLRQHLRARLAAAAPQLRSGGILPALALGDQSGISTADWQVLRDTGTAHLVAVSGLHVSMIAVLCGSLASWLWRRKPRLLLRHPARQVGIAAGLLGAGVYTLLSGMGIPARRAWLMLAVYGFALLQRRRPGLGQGLAWTLAVVVAIDPWAVVSAGFWLSFGAVALIGYLLGSSSRDEARWRQGLRVQFSLSVGMAPLLLILFGRFPLVSPLANLVAVPLTTFVLTPLSLLCAVFPLDWPVRGTDWLAATMLQGLHVLAAVPWAVWQQAAPPPALALLALIGLLWAALPRPTPARLTGLLAVVPVLLWHPPRPPQGEVWIRVLDVGQGLAVHLQTASRDYLYDAGPDWRGEADAGSRIVLPYLRGEGLRALDGMLLSHDDVDHTGGALAVATALSLARQWSSLPARAPRLPTGGAARQLRCEAGQAWQVDGVDFRILSPEVGDYTRGLADNSLSCVLRVGAGGRSVLLTGDLDQAGERGLLARTAAGALRADIVVVGHHGSRSSSSRAFVDALSPIAAVYSAGYRNSFHHPAPEVLARWEAAGARTWRTDQDGSILIRLGVRGAETEAWRPAHRHYWELR